MNGWRSLFGDRYGIDNLNVALIVAALVLSLVGRIFPRVVVFPVVGILLILLVFYRALSRKVVMRQAENEKFSRCGMGCGTGYEPPIGRIGAAIPLQGVGFRQMPGNSA